MSKHTLGPLHNVTGARPGPWIRQVLNDESEAYIHDKHCNAIARVYSLSDAALIAAAPAMYEALKELREHSDTVLRDIGLPHDDAMLMLALIDNATRALAQAEGRG